VLMLRTGDAVTTPAGGGAGITWQTFATPVVSGNGMLSLLGFRQGGTYN
jgi:hypothetical protein